MSWVKRYFPEFIVKPLPRFFVEKFTEFRVDELKSMQLKTIRKVSYSNTLQLAANFLTGQ